MGLISDLLKDIPLSSVVKERLALAEDKYKLLQEENARLKVELASNDSNETVSLEFLAGFKVVDIAEASQYWESFEGEFYSWNPSWHTELSQNTGKRWTAIHEKRYSSSTLIAAHYFVGIHGPVSSKYFNLEGLARFLFAFRKTYTSHWANLQKKMKVYVDMSLPSNLSFFVGNREGRKYGLLLVNEAPLFQEHTPRYALITEKEDIIRRMIGMIDIFIQEHSAISPEGIFTLADMLGINVEH